jgi:hypothetical protein
MPLLWAAKIFHKIEFSPMFDMKLKLKNPLKKSGKNCYEKEKCDENHVVKIFLFLNI